MQEFPLSPGLQDFDFLDKFSSGVVLLIGEYLELCLQGMFST